MAHVGVLSASHGSEPALSPSSANHDTPASAEPSQVEQIASYRAKLAKLLAQVCGSTADRQMQEVSDMQTDLGGVPAHIDVSAQSLRAPAEAANVLKSKVSRETMSDELLVQLASALSDPADGVATMGDQALQQWFDRHNLAKAVEWTKTTTAAQYHTTRPSLNTTPKLRPKPTIPKLQLACYPFAQDSPGDMHLESKKLDLLELELQQVLALRSKLQGLEQHSNHGGSEVALVSKLAKLRRKLSTRRTVEDINRDIELTRQALAPQRHTNMQYWRQTQQQSYNRFLRYTTDKTRGASTKLAALVHNVQNHSPTPLPLPDELTARERFALETHWPNNMQRCVKHFIFAGSSPAWGAKVIRDALVCAGYTDCFPSVADENNLTGTPTQDYDPTGKPFNSFMVLPSSPNEDLLSKMVGDDGRSIFNSPLNKHGMLCSIVIADSKYTQGISLFDVRVVHLFDQVRSLNMKRQAIARGIRACGHRLDGPGTANNQWQVDLLQYTSTDPTGKFALTEMQLLQDALKESRSFDRFLAALESSAIDRGFYNYIGGHGAGNPLELPLPAP